jgi:hypothetical protein
VQRRNARDHLTRRGHQVTVHMRRDDPELPERVVAYISI